jgi:hypothetical protein
MYFSFNLKKKVKTYQKFVWMSGKKTIALDWLDQGFWGDLDTKLNEKRNKLCIYYESISLMRNGIIFAAVLTETMADIDGLAAQTIADYVAMAL